MTLEEMTKDRDRWRQEARAKTAEAIALRSHASEFLSKYDAAREHLRALTAKDDADRLRGKDV